MRITRRSRPTRRERAAHRQAVSRARDGPDSQEIILRMDATCRFDGRSAATGSRGILVCAIIASLLATCGCAANINKNMQSWVGHQQSELILAWGPPSRIMPDGNGGAVLIYEGFVNLGQSPGRGTVDAWGNITYTAPQQQGWARSRMFYVDREGKIYAWRWQGL